MRPEEIAQRCRKVFINVTDGKIFEWHTAGHSGEYQMITAFRQEADAKARTRTRTQIWYTGAERRQVETTRGFYLVPIEKIDANLSDNPAASR